MRNEHDSRQLRRYSSVRRPTMSATPSTDYFDAPMLPIGEGGGRRLIDDYLSGRLDGSERSRFERHYLTTPNHRRRVAIVRAMRNAASTRQPFGPRGPVSVRWTTASVAASLLILVSAGPVVPRAAIRSGGRLHLVQSPAQPAAPSASADAGVPSAAPGGDHPLPVRATRRQRRSSSPSRSLQFWSAEIVNRQRSPCREESTS